MSHILYYFLPLFKILTSVVSKIEKLQRDFLWSEVREGKKDYPVSWNMMCRPKEYGGVGFQDDCFMESYSIMEVGMEVPIEKF